MGGGERTGLWKADGVGSEVAVVFLVHARRGKGHEDALAFPDERHELDERDAVVRRRHVERVLPGRLRLVERLRVQNALATSYITPPTSVRAQQPKHKTRAAKDTPMSAVAHTGVAA
eukprot:3700450-Rhodomonas_salina.6